MHKGITTAGSSITAAGLTLVLLNKVDAVVEEVILKGDSSPPTLIVDGAVQIVAPTTAEQRLAKKNELKAGGTLLMPIEDSWRNYLLGRHQLEILKKSAIRVENSHLIWRNKADLEEQSLDELFNNLKIYETKVKGSSLSRQNTQNIAFVSSNNTDSINESLNAAPSISADSSKAKVSTLPNVDSLSDAVIYSFFASHSNSTQLDNEDLKQIDPDDLEEIDLKWHMVMLTMRARRFLKRTGRNLGNADHQGTTGTKKLLEELSQQSDEEPPNYVLMAYASSGSSSSSGSDNEVAPCSKACSKAYATLQTHYDNLIVEFRKSQLYVLSYKTGLELVEARLVMYQKNEIVFEQDIKLLKLNVMLRDNVLAKLRKKFKKAKKEINDLKLTLDKFQTSSKNLSNLLESQVSDKFRLGFNNQVFNSQVFDYEEFHNHEFDNRVPKNPKNDRYKTGEGYHDVPPAYTGAFLPLKPDLVFTNDPNAIRMTHPNSIRNVVPTIVLTRSRLMSLNAARPVLAAVTQSTMKSIWPVKHVFVKLYSSVRRSINQITTTKNSNLNKKVTTVKANKVNDVQGHKEIDRGYVAFRENPKGGKIYGKGKIKTGKLDCDDVYFVKELKFILLSVSQICDKKNSVLFIDTECVVLSSDYKLPDENHILLRVPRENNMYNVDLKNVVPSGDLTCLFANFTLDESNLWHMRLGHINFKTMNKLVKGNLVRGLPSNIFENNHTYVACQKGNQHKASLIRPKWLFDIDTLTMSMNYQPVVSRNQPTDNAGIKENLDACKVRKETVSAQQYVLLPLWSTGLQDPQNIADDVADDAFDVKENKNDVHVSANRSDKSDNKKHDENAKRDDKGMSLVDSPTGVRDLRAEFEEFSFNSANRVNAVSAPVNAVGPNPPNSTNSFNTASPFVNVVSLNFRIARKSSFVDPSKYPDYPDMPELKDILYSDDEEDVGAEADLSNLETNIHVSPIPTARVYKDHPVNQIISDLNSAPQIRNVKSASTPIETGKPLLKDPNGEDVDVHIYRSMIRSLMYLTSSRPDIMFAVCACVRFQVTLKVSHLHAVKRIFSYLKGKPHLGLWYPRDSPFNLVAYYDSDYAGASLDRKSTIRGCQFLGCRLISWQCKSAKRTAWNEFSYFIAFAVIYLATGGCIKIGEKIEAIDAGKSITLVDVETNEEVVAMDVESQGRLNQEGVSAADPTYDDKEKNIDDKEENIDKQEKADMERALELQNQYDDKEENIDWSDVAEQVQERHLDSIRKYQNLKKKPIIRVGGIIETYQVFEDMLKGFDREDLVALWNLVKEKKNYPLSNAVMILMLSGKLQVEEDNEMARDLVMKIFTEANKPKNRNLKKMDKGIITVGSSITAACSTLVLLDKVDAAVEVLKSLL
uniref:Uncharacterized mitochondrial protein AtMg00810-like n=1 Tax=Tanacetum cinerariifolium TaxID=118510 RepID=A0A6L2KCS9_TANCI|nr:uncharacterized mitochondrial protein AtMg00810-like [Tanacetum cinerariifolium]